MRRKLILGCVIACVATLGAPASADPPAEFDADVKGHVQRPVGCPDGAYLCGNATVHRDGPAEFRWHITSYRHSSDTCGQWTATTTFTLLDGSVLTVDEAGTVCGPGRSYFASPRGYGQPADGAGSWQATGGTGRFAGAAGSGHNVLSVNGASIRANYTGMLTTS